MKQSFLFLAALTILLLLTPEIWAQESVPEQTSASEESTPVVAAVVEPVVEPVVEAETPPEPVAQGSTLSPSLTQELKEGLIDFQKGDFDSAKAHFSKVTVAAPEHQMAFVNLAAVEYKLGQLEEAVVNLERAVALDAKTFQAWITLGIINFELGRLDEALAAISRAVVLDPSSPKAHSYLGIVVGAKGWLLGAESELRKAVELDPGFADAHFNLALIYLQRTPPAVELARRHYREALRLGAAPDPVLERQIPAMTSDSEPQDENSGSGE